nr:DUF2147 domain-containing protein [Labrys miyagiensis]
MFRTLVTTGVLLGAICTMVGVAYAEDMIIGEWKTSDGDTVVINHCGDGYCGTIEEGEYAGRQIGKLTGSGGSYTGQLTDPDDNQTYDGTGAVQGNSLILKGCLMKIFCQSQVWTRR